MTYKIIVAISAILVSATWGCRDTEKAVPLLPGAFQEDARFELDSMRVALCELDDSRSRDDILEAAVYGRTLLSGNDSTR